MCKAKSEGGQRCAGCLRKKQTRTNKAYDDWVKRVAEVEYQIENEIPAPNKARNLVIAKRNLEETIEKMGKVAVELAEAEVRRNEKIKTKPQAKNRFMGADLKASEWAILTEEAKALGYKSRSALIRKRLRDLPTIKSVEATSTKRQEWENGAGATWGRQPTTGAKGNYERGSRGVRTDDATIERLEAEAEIFGITRSDYTRCLLLDLDPRSLGHHIGEKRAEELREKVGNREQNHTVTAQDTKTFWTDQVLEVRRNLGITV